MHVRLFAVLTVYFVSSITEIKLTVCNTDKIDHLVLQPMICSVLLKSFELRQQAICLRCINSFSVHSRSFKTRAAAA